LPQSEFHTDPELLAQLANDNEQAFQLLYSRHWKRLYSAAFKRLPDHDMVKDILQEIFLQLWLRRSNLKISNLEAYLSRAVRNRVLKQFEQEDRYTPLETLLAELGNSSSNADALVLRDELRKAYKDLLDSLTPSQRTILQLRYEQDLSTEEIAQLLDISRKTVQNQLRTALLQIRSSLPIMVLSVILKNFFQ
jgi:RNA polymerase sigma factor (sigma-70 family)